MNTTLLANAQRLTVLLGICVAAVAGLTSGPSGAAAAAVGGALGAGNLAVVRRLAARATRAAEAGDPRGAAPLLVGMFVKLVALFALVFIATRTLRLPLVPFTFGLFGFVLALFAAALWSGWGDALSSDVPPVTPVPSLSKPTDGQGVA